MLAQCILWFHVCLTQAGIMSKQLEFERSTKKRIGPSCASTRFFVHNFGRLRARSDLPGHSRSHQQTLFSSWIFC